MDFQMHHRTITPRRGPINVPTWPASRKTMTAIWIKHLQRPVQECDHHTGRVTQYYKEDGIGGNQFNDRSSTITPTAHWYWRHPRPHFFNPKQFDIRHKIRVMLRDWRSRPPITLRREAASKSRSTTILPFASITTAQFSPSVLLPSTMENSPMCSIIIG